MKIDVEYKPNKYDMEDGEFICSHMVTTPDTLEECDYYKEVVTGTPQPVYTEEIEVCDGCNAYFSDTTKEWHEA